MGIFHLIWIAIVGLVVGLIAHFIVPSSHPMPWRGRAALRCGNRGVIARP